jgi:hypothetical protein
LGVPDTQAVSRIHPTFIFELYKLQVVLTARDDTLETEKFAGDETGCKYPVRALIPNTLIMLKENRNNIGAAHNKCLQIFINKWLRKILRIFWPDCIKNTELWKRTKQPRTDLQVRKRKWGWLDHILRKPHDVITRRALEWNPQGKRGRWRPRNTWRRMVLEEAKGVNKTWAEIKTDAKTRVRWRILVEAPCSAAE